MNAWWHVTPGRVSVPLVQTMQAARPRNPFRHGCKCRSCSSARCRFKTGVPHSSAATCLAQYSTAHGSACSRARWVSPAVCSGVDQRYTTPTACRSAYQSSFRCMLFPVLFHCPPLPNHSLYLLKWPGIKSTEADAHSPTHSSPTSTPATWLPMLSLSLVTCRQREGVTPTQTLHP